MYITILIVALMCLSFSLSVYLYFFIVCFCLFLDRKNCEGLMEKPLDLGYNAASFMWDPRLGARVSGGEGREGGGEGGKEGEREGESKKED